MIKLIWFQQKSLKSVLKKSIGKKTVHANILKHVIGPKTLHYHVEFVHEFETMIVKLNEAELKRKKKKKKEKDRSYYVQI